ncbi:hypothetical protein AAFN46_07485 [Pseudomonas sp. CAU 1711]|uniref:hypothetical protein n=1 Tax=Pseudomonas sp. CAU 1711 TaxID=3140356 RepID=UPI003261A2CC
MPSPPPSAHTFGSTATVSLLLSALACELLALSTGLDWASMLSAGLYGAFFLAHWRSLLPYPRRLGLITLAVAGLWGLHQPSLAATRGLAATFAYYASFVAALGLIQCLIARLPQLGELHRALLNGPRALLYPRYLGGALALGALLSFGMLNLLYATLRPQLDAPGVGAETRRNAQRGVISCALRGFALVPLLAPTSVTMAIIGREIPHLGWIDLLPFGAITALLLLLLSWRGEHRNLRALPELPWPAARVAWGKPLAGALLGCTAIVLLALYTPLNPSQAAMLTIPIGVLGCLLHWTSVAKAQAELTRTLDGQRNEVFIFGCSALLGGLVAQLVPLQGLAAPLLKAPWLLHALEIGLLLGIPALALFGIAPIVSLNLLAALLAQLAHLGIAPLGPAIALVSGFALAMLLSPFGPSALLLERLSGISARELSLGWNGRLALMALPFLLLLPGLAQL